MAGVLPSQRTSPQGGAGTATWPHDKTACTGKPQRHQPREQRYIYLTTQSISFGCYMLPCFPSILLCSNRWDIQRTPTPTHLHCIRLASFIVIDPFSITAMPLNVICMKPCHTTLAPTSPCQCVAIYCQALPALAPLLASLKPAHAIELCNMTAVQKVAD